MKQLFKDALAEEKKKVVQAGGLYVLGTTRHESRRIDNQLRGRAGRQGDPGTSRFFISLQDEVFKVFGGDRIESLMDRFRLGDEIPLQSSIVNNTLDRVQTAVEEFFKKTRTTLFEFDKVISKQRELTYGVRKLYLVESNEEVRKLVEEWAQEAVVFHTVKVNEQGEGWSREKPVAMSEKERAEEFEEYFGWPQPSYDTSATIEKQQEELRPIMLKAVGEKWVEYESFRPNFGAEAARIATVVTIDDEWKTLLQKMDALKQTVGLATYKGSDPLKEYQVQGFRMYRRVENLYKARSISRWLRSKPKKDADPTKQEG